MILYGDKSNITEFLLKKLSTLISSLIIWAVCLWDEVHYLSIMKSIGEFIAAFLRDIDLILISFMQCQSISHAMMKSDQISPRSLKIEAKT